MHHRSLASRLTHLLVGAASAVIASRGRHGGAAGASIAAGAVADHLLGPVPLTAADHVTRLRLSLVQGSAAAAILGRERSTGIAALLSAGVALDAVDGAVARCTSGPTDRGARFDTEADAFAVATLSVVGVTAGYRWAAIPGALRYVFVLAGLVIPALTTDLPPRPSRRLIAGASMAMMAAAAWPQVPDRGRSGLLAASTLALVFSFGRDALCQLHRDRR